MLSLSGTALIVLDQTEAAAQTPEKSNIHIKQAVLCSSLLLLLLIIVTLIKHGAAASVTRGSDLLEMPLQSLRSITTRRNWIFTGLSGSSAVLPHLQPAAASAGYTPAYLPQYRRNQLSGLAGLSRRRAQINSANALKYPELFFCVVLSALHVLWQARK